MSSEFPETKSTKKGEQVNKPLNRDELESALAGVLMNVLNFPEPVHSRMLGLDLSPLLDKTAHAVLNAGWRKMPSGPEEILAVAAQRLRDGNKYPDDFKGGFKAAVDATLALMSGSGNLPNVSEMTSHQHRKEAERLMQKSRAYRKAAGDPSSAGPKVRASWEKQSRIMLTEAATHATMALYPPTATEKGDTK